MEAHIINIFSDSLLKAFTWTLIHSLWQGVFLAAIIGITISATKKSNPGFRYVLFTLYFLSFLITVSVTFFVEFNSYKSHFGLLYPVGYGNNSFYGSAIIADHISPTNSVELISQYCNRNSTIIAFIWIIIFIWKCFKLSVDCYYSYRIKYSRTFDVPSDWEAELKVLKQQFRITQNIVLLQSELIKIPAVIGLFKPFILFPAGFASTLSIDEVKTILLHELAHIKRMDQFVNLLQCLMDMVFFFNPAVLWLSKLIIEEREACCDDIVINYSNNIPGYIRTILLFQQSFQQSTLIGLTLKGDNDNLVKRIRRMCFLENRKLHNLEKLLLVFGLTVVMAFTIMRKQGIVVENIAKTAIKANRVAVNSNLFTEYKKQADKDIHNSGKRKLKRSKNLMMYDTIPAVLLNSNQKELPTSFETISTIATIKEGRKIITTTAVDNNGKKFIIEEFENRITVLSVNGREIAPGNFDEYNDIISFVNYIRDVRKHNLPPEADTYWQALGRLRVLYGNKAKKIFIENSDKDSAQIKIAQLDKELRGKNDSLIHELQVKIKRLPPDVK